MPAPRSRPAGRRQSRRNPPGGPRRNPRADRHNRRLVDRDFRRLAGWPDDSRGARRQDGPPRRPDDCPPLDDCRRRQACQPRQLLRACQPRHSSRPASPADAARPAGPADAAGPAGSANSPGSANSAGPAGSADPAWPARTAGAAGPAGPIANSRFAALPGTIVAVRTPLAIAIADIYVVADVDVAVVDRPAAPARIAAIGAAPARVERAASPVPPGAGRQRAERDARAEGEQRRDDGSPAPHRVRIVGGNVHHRGIGRHDRDVIASALRRDDASTCASCGWRRARPDPLHRLLGVRLERARALRLGAQLLDRRRDILRLVNDRVAKVGRPRKILAHLFDEVWKTRHRFDRGVPFLAVDAGKVVFRDKRLIFLKPALRLNDFERIGGRGQKLGEQGVRIKRDRRQQLAQFLTAEFVGFRRWLLRLPSRSRGRCRRSWGFRRRGRRGAQAEQALGLQAEPARAAPRCSVLGFREIRGDGEGESEGDARASPGSAEDGGSSPAA